MSTILQPCFESQFIETATVKLKFTPPPPPTTTDVCGLSFQQVLAGICSTPTAAAADNKESIYVHPLSKRSSSSRFSEKSFEMCTENLGSETGTDDIMTMTENDDFFFLYNNNYNISLSSSSSSSSSSSPVSPSSPREYSSLRSPSSFNKNCKKSHSFSSSKKNFPPPLTTITGAKSIQVRSHREDGRLVMRAVPTPVTHTYLQAERSNGRLKLTLYNHNHHDNDEINQINSEKKQEQHDLQEEEEEISDNQEDYYYEEEEEEEEEEINERDLNHTIIINEDECEEIQEMEMEMGMGMEKYKSISRRCNESGGHHTNTVLYYKPLWVATS